MTKSKRILNNWILENLGHLYNADSRRYELSLTQLTDLLLTAPQPSGTYTTFNDITLARYIINLREKEDWLWDYIAKIVKSNHPQLGIDECSITIGKALYTRADTILENFKKLK